MNLNTLSVVDVTNDRALKKLKAGDSYELKDSGLSIKLLDDKGSILLEADPSRDDSVPVFVNGIEVIDVVQIKPGDLVETADILLTIVKEGQPVVIGRQRIRIPDDYKAKNTQTPKSFQLIGLIVFSYILLSGLFVMVDLSDNEDDSCSVEEVDQTIGQLPVELRKRSKEEEKKLEDAYVAFKGAGVKVPDQSPDPMKSVIKEYERPADDASLLTGEKIENTVQKQQSDDSAKDILVDEKSEDHPIATKLTPAKDDNKSSGRPDPIKKNGTTVQRYDRGNDSLHAKARAGKSESTRLSERFKQLIPYYRLAQDGQYEALRDIAIVMEEADRAGNLSVGLIKTLDEIRQIWKKGLNEATRKMIDGKEKPALRRLILYLLYRFRIYISGPVEGVLEKYDRHLQRKFDEAVLLSPLDPNEAVKKLKHLESLVPGIHPLSKELKSQISSKAP